MCTAPAPAGRSDLSATSATPAHTTCAPCARSRSANRVPRASESPNSSTVPSTGTLGRKRSRRCHSGRKNQFGMASVDALDVRTLRTMSANLPSANCCLSRLR
ncbi:Uncharacterised protein [Mycobacteroides abscessus subsp. abscessus]|nr:Uncharacterised protein [Mycobacteroides abscessus subsp. abscessus]